MPLYGLLQLRNRVKANMEKKIAADPVIDESSPLPNDNPYSYLIGLAKKPEPEEKPPNVAVKYYYPRY